MKRKHWSLIFILFFILLAAFTNPDTNRHKECIKKELNAYIQNATKSSRNSNSLLEQAGKALGQMFGGVLVDRITDNYVSVNNYILFSTSNFIWDGKTYIIGIGAFGNVFISGKLKEVLDKKKLELINM
jgi:hypothetical protein